AESKQFIYTHVVLKIIIFEIHCRKGVGGFDEKHLIKLWLSQRNSHSTFAVPRIIIYEIRSRKSVGEFDEKGSIKLG
uniref:hypothetical protein n=1 Tax=Chryseobacterium mucoviscidosis TaxID=1945581 RepID=UPI00301AD748